MLVRDRFGVRPLFYHLTPNALFYGSEAKTLLAHPDIPKRLDRRAALHQMMQTMVPGTSAFQGISALLPGHMMVVSRDGDRLRTETHRYWDMDFPRAEEHDDNPDPKEYIDGVASQLIDAVRVRLEADVPVGCYLSGGIDSCSILGLSTAMQQSAVKAFTISFDHDKYDEAAVATEMAMSTGADQEVLHLSAAELYGESFVRTAWHAERTFYNTLGVAKWHMSRRVRECGFKVVVTGEGSDEMYAGYPFFKRDYFLHAPEARTDSEALLAKMDASNDVFKGAILSESSVEHEAMNDLCGFTPSWIQPWMLTLRRGPTAVFEAGSPGARGLRPDSGDCGRARPEQAARTPRPGQGAVHLDQDHARRPDPELGRRPSGHGQLDGVAASLPRPSASGARVPDPAAIPHPRRRREMGAARSHEGRAARDCSTSERSSPSWRPRGTRMQRSERRCVSLPPSI